MIASRDATRSENTVSALSRPAITEMMSELGFVYRLLSTTPRNTVKVWFVSRTDYGEDEGEAHLKRVLVRGCRLHFDVFHRPNDKFLCMTLVRVSVRSVRIPRLKGQYL